MRKTRSFLKLPVLLVTVFIGKARFCDRSPDQFHQRWRHRRPDPLKPRLDLWQAVWERGG
jgi:hypothetical protein